MVWKEMNLHTSFFEMKHTIPTKIAITFQPMLICTKPKEIKFKILLSPI